MPSSQDDKDKDEEGTDTESQVKGTAKEINGQLIADLEFADRAEKLISKLRSKEKAPGEEPDRLGQRTRDVTDKHK